MKFFHISDLHIGKRVNGFSMLEDQRYILAQIIDLAREHRPEGILIAGDLYDKPVPGAEAVEMADWFLTSLAREQIPVWVIAGNHDSGERIAYGGQLMTRSGIYMSRVFDGKLQKYTVTKYEDGRVKIEQQDEWPGTEKAGETEGGGEVAERLDITLLPFLRPAQVRRFFPDKEIGNTQQAIAAVLETAEIKKDRANILVMHQFMAGSVVCESEEISVGGSDQVDVSVVRDFDYVALGHLHGPQKVGRETVRYCGSPLKYSFSEADHRKSVTVAEILPGSGEASDSEAAAGPGEAENETEGDKIAGDKTAGCIRVYTLPLIPRLDLREIRGPMEELLRPEIYGAANREDYLHVTLTDKNEILDAIGRLREVYPNVMRLDFENTGAEVQAQEEILLEEKTPLELFEEFFLLQNGREMEEEQKKIAEEILKNES